VAAEMFPHTGTLHADGYDVDVQTAKERPHIMLARHFGEASSKHASANFFAGRFDGTGGACMTVVPMFGDDLVSPEVAEKWIGLGLKVSPMMGFERTRPDTAEFLRSAYSA